MCVFMQILPTPRKQMFESSSFWFQLFYLIAQQPFTLEARKDDIIV